MKKYKFMLAMGLFVVASLLTGCSARKTTTVSTTEVRAEPRYSEVSDYDRNPSVEVTKTEKVTEGDGHKGFFGILGDVIALPFRAVASVL